MDTTKNILNYIKTAKNYTSLDTKSAENIILYIYTIGKNTATLKTSYILKKSTTQNCHMVSVISDHQNVVSITTNSPEISFQVMWLLSQPIRLLQINKFKEKMCDFKFFFSI